MISLFFFSIKTKRILLLAVVTGALRINLYYAASEDYIIADTFYNVELVFLRSHLKSNEICTTKIPISAGYLPETDNISGQPNEGI